MTNINAIIIDDEAASRLTLRNYVAKYCPQVSILDEAENIDEAYKKINSLKPDFIFLDVEMPFGNAFDLLEKFESPEFEIIFVTAYSDYALDALNLSASRYLLKPVNIDQLIEAVEAVSEQLKNKASVQTSSILLENLNIENKQLKKMVLPMLDGFEVILLKDIIRCQANDNLCDIYLADGSKKTVCRTLKFYETALSDFDFIRTHKSHLINANCVKQYKRGKGGEIILNNGTVIPLSPSRKEKFISYFN